METKNLGKQVPHVFVGADKSLLERVPNPNSHLGDVIRTTVTIKGDEFTSVCPVTGGPDMGEIIVTYMPQDWIVESKSFKYYMESYRNEPIFHEAIVAKICNDLGSLLECCFLTVSGNFKARGGWAFLIDASYNRYPQLDDGLSDYARADPTVAQENI